MTPLRSRRIMGQGQGRAAKRQQVRENPEGAVQGAEQFPKTGRSRATRYHDAGTLAMEPACHKARLAWSPAWHKAWRPHLRSTGASRGHGSHEGGGSPMMSWVALALVPVGPILHILGLPPIWVFLAGILGVGVLADWIRRATERRRRTTSPGSGVRVCRQPPSSGHR